MSKSEQVFETKREKLDQILLEYISVHPIICQYLQNEFVKFEKTNNKKPLIIVTWNKQIEYFKDILKLEEIEFMNNALVQFKKDWEVVPQVLDLMNQSNSNNMLICVSPVAQYQLDEWRMNPIQAPKNPVPHLFAFLSYDEKKEQK